MSEEGETTGLHDDESSSLEEAPPAIEVKAAPMVEVAVEPEKETPKSNGSKFLIGLLVPVLVLLFLTNSSLFSAEHGISTDGWRLRCTATMTASSGLMQIPRHRTALKNPFTSSSLTLLTPPIHKYTGQIHIGSTWEYEREPYNEHCEVESVNTVHVSSQTKWKWRFGVYETW